MRVFKFKKYKDGYEDGKQGAAPRYPLEIGAFLEDQGLGRLAGCGSSAAEAENP